MGLRGPRMSPRPSRPSRASPTHREAALGQAGVGAPGLGMGTTVLPTGSFSACRGTPSFLRRFS